MFHIVKLFLAKPLNWANRNLMVLHCGKVDQPVMAPLRPLAHENRSDRQRQREEIPDTQPLQHLRSDQATQPLSTQTVNMKVFF